MVVRHATSMAPDDYDARHWDVIIIGTGIGGGTVGRRLAEQGASVLFLERGGIGHRSERHGLSKSVINPAARRTRGYWPTSIPLDCEGQALSLGDSLGAGVGGTSVFYAAAFERPERHDLDATETRAHPTGGWPVPYHRFAPYLDDAENIFAVNGGQDPLSQEPALTLRAPPDLSPGDAALFRRMEDVGLHPYRLRSAIRHVDGCMECIGVKCPRDCKMDGRSAGVEPALKTGNAALVPNFQVTQLTGSNGRVEGVVGRRDGETRRVTGRIVIMSAGGLGSPALLLASASDAWPDGCANSSGQVGCGLMFHLHDLVAVWPPKGLPLGYPAKCISLRDLYYVDGQRFGIFQSLGLSASYGNILHALRQRLERSPAARIP
ncbi:MAG: GMC family oxidoreductase N-terminal domain-containing protein, partial [Pseudomonadota bacterium]